MPYCSVKGENQSNQCYKRIFFPTCACQGEASFFSLSFCQRCLCDIRNNLKSNQLKICCIGDLIHLWRSPVARFRCLLAVICITVCFKLRIPSNSWHSPYFYWFSSYPVPGHTVVLLKTDASVISSTTSINLVQMHGRASKFFVEEVINLIETVFQHIVLIKLSYFFISNLEGLLQ